MSIRLQAAPQLHWVSNPSNGDSGVFKNAAYESLDLSSDSEICPVHVNDSYINEDPSKVLIYCVGKSVAVQAILSKPVTIHGTSTWSSFLKQALGPMGSLLNFADLVAQFQGDSLKQPFFSRKVWEGSEPLRFDLELDLIAVGQYLYDKSEGDVAIHNGPAAYLEVYIPACNIMSLLYPGWQMDDQNLVPNSMQIPGPSAFGNIDHTAYKKEFSQTKKDNNGQPFYLSIGSFLLFHNCLATQCSVTFGTQLDRWGYPMQAKVTLTVETYEAPFVELVDDSEKNNRLPFAFNRIPVTNESAKDALNNTLASFGKVAQKFVGSLGDIAKTLKEFIESLLLD